MTKDVKKLVKAVVAQGGEVREGTKHYELRREGAVLARVSKGGKPMKRRAFENLVAQLRRGGVAL